MPLLLTRDEVRPVLQHLDGVPRLMVLLLNDAGLRLLGCCRLRVKDVDFATNQILVHGAVPEVGMVLLPGPRGAGRVGGAVYAGRTAVEDMGVDHGRGDILVSPATRIYVEPTARQR